MDTITLTVTKDEARMIKDALNLQAVRLAKKSKTIGAVGIRPDYCHEMWNRNITLWYRIYIALWRSGINQKED